MLVAGVSTADPVSAATRAASQTVSTKIPVGKAPEGVAVDPTLNKAFAANNVGGDVSVIDGVTKKVTATTVVGIRPSDVAVDPTTHMVYVVDEGFDGLWAIDGQTEQVVWHKDLRAGRPRQGIHGVAVNPVTNTIYVAVNPSN